MLDEFELELLEELELEFEELFDDEFEFAESVTRPDQAVMEPLPVFMVEGTMVVSDLGSRRKCNCKWAGQCALLFFGLVHVRCLSVFLPPVLEEGREPSGLAIFNLQWSPFDVSFFICTTLYLHGNQ